MQRIDRLLELLLGSLLALMVLDVTWQILTRFLPMSPSSYTEELARYLLVWIGILGAAYAYRRHSHLGIDLLTNALPEKLRIKVRLLTICLCFAFAASVMVFGGVQLVLLTFELNQLSAALNVPMGYVYSVIPLSGGLICLFCIDQLLQLVFGGSAGRDVVEQSAELASARG
ncbi:TRAP transporter small permease [Microbulbifer taiwanensis]|uniref:TRAP transporter small permease protein n=1 Tax=Microbulbifer taiwanensis TaxID=986746 RepID=A0ABW1YS47_9GAMM|nr:TRAP transporter small permease [Microbulbifer taiwanensis]